MRTLTFSSNGATIEVREEIGRDVFMRGGVYNVLVEHLLKKHNLPVLPDALWHTVIGFERILSRTVKIEGHIPFDLPSPFATNDALVAGYEAAMEAPVELIQAWENHLAKVTERPIQAVLEGKTIPES